MALDHAKGRLAAMPDPYSPPPAPLPGGGHAIAVDVEEVSAKVRLEPGTGEATATAEVRFTVGSLGGRPALDLRQGLDGSGQGSSGLDSLRLDGRPLAPSAWAPADLGGGPGAQMRVLDVELPAGGRHRLEVGYPLAQPSAQGALPIDWRGRDGVRWDLWMSDLHPGRYLEMWVPAPLCHDRFALRVDVELVSTDRPHVVVTNGRAEPTGSGWAVHFPYRFTSLSPMLVVAPADEVEQRQTEITLAGRPAPLALRSTRHLDVDVDLEACEADVASWLVSLAQRYGPWVHGDAMTVFVWGPGRGMEYDGATTAAEGALEHEVFHSWFGRGVKPACAGDGWIDEAWTSWATSTRRSEEPRYGAEPLDLDGEPVVLRPPHPWARFTPGASYTAGARLFSGLAHLLGGAPQLRSAMAAWYRANAGGLVSTDGLESHLRAWSGVDIGPWWQRYVHGQG